MSRVFCIRPSVVEAANSTYVGSFRLPVPPGTAHFGIAGSLIRDLSSTRLAMMSRVGHTVLLQAPTTGTGAFNTWPIVGYDSVIEPPPDKPTDTGFFSALLNNDQVVLNTCSIFYDANNTQRLGHYYNGEWRTVLDDHLQGHVAGWMFPIPSAWQSAMGGNLITGQGTLPIISRTSAGPAAYIVTLAAFDTPGVVPADVLIDYPTGHALAAYDSSSLYFNQTCVIRGGGFYSDARGSAYDELIFAGTIGESGYCYGNGTDDPLLHNTIGGDGELLCYDPDLPPDKGGHASVYRYQIWRYRVQEVLDATNPWDVQPVIEKLTKPPNTGYPTRLIGAQMVGNTLYCSQYNAENSPRVGTYPFGHVYNILPR